MQREVDAFIARKRREQGPTQPSKPFAVEAGIVARDGRVSITFVKAVGFLVFTPDEALEFTSKLQAATARAREQRRHMRGD